MDKVSLTSQAAEVSARAAPPVMVSSLSIFGVALPDVVAILTLVYLCVHIGYIAHKWYKGK